MPGKRHFQVWEHFCRDSAKYNNIKTICNYCNEVIQAIPKRMKKHIATCMKIRIDSDVEIVSDEQRMNDIYNCIK